MSPSKKQLVPDLRSMCRAHTKVALNTLVRVCCSNKANPAARVQAAIALLDRGWGKPVQPVATTDKQEIRVLIRNIIDPSPGSVNPAQAIAAKLIEHEAKEDTS